MRKQTIVDQVEIKRDGMIHVRFAKQIIDDDERVLSSGWHRATFEPGSDVTAMMAAVNRNLLDDLGHAPVESGEVTGLIAPLLPVVWTTARVSAYRQKIAKINEAIAAGPKAKA